MRLEESDVESYYAVINVSTKCHPTREDANKVFKAAFNKAKEAAEEELKNVPSGLNVVRINTVQSPYEHYNDRAIARRIVVDTLPADNFSFESADTRTRWENTQWLDHCTGEIVSEGQRKKHWGAEQSFRVLTSSYAAYRRVKEMAEQSVGEVDEDSSYLARQQYPIVRPTDSPVVLKSEPWRRAVDAQLYEQALYKLTDPAGPVAEHLNSEYVKATRAYYSLGQSSFVTPQSGFAESLSDAASSKAYDGERIVVDDSNLNLHQETAARSYTITWKPVYDLMVVIKARAAEQDEQDSNVGEQ